MSDTPRIYVSSTIYDFSDLRSALKYWLEEFGFEVQMSEFNDFEVNLDLNSFQACLDAIPYCDYLILLLGGRRGAWFNQKEKVSITQKEYRTAYELAKKGQIKIITFIRKSIWNIKEDRKALEKSSKNKKLPNAKSKVIENPEFIFSFIDEVRRAKEMKQATEGKTQFPPNNWIYLFDNFKDIFDALRIHLNLAGDLKEKTIKCNLVNELETNISNSDIKFKNRKYSGNVINILKIERLFDIKASVGVIDVDNKLLKLLTASAVLLMQNFKSFALKDAIRSGIFLEYNREQGKYEVGKIQELLLRLNDFIEQIESIVNSKLLIETKNYLLDILKSTEHFPDDHTVKIEIIYLVSAFSFANIYWNIYQISTFIYGILIGKKPSKIELYPVDVFSKETKEIIEM